MTMSSDDRDSLETLEARLRAILPDEYQDTYEEVQPVSMGSAGMRYDVDGRVAWNEMWATFCDLAMAGGPPHKGTLLEPASPAQIASQPDRYAQVVEEISRGIRMVTDLTPEPSPIPGWVRVDCLGEGMAGWLLRAIVMENVSARADGTALDLPAGPDYRLEKEIKNVITVIAKTCHYWEGHMWRAEQRFVAELFATIAVESPLLQPFLGRWCARGQPSGGVRADGRAHSSRHRASFLEPSIRRLAWCGVPERPRRSLDDARDGGEQHPVAAARGSRSLCPSIRLPILPATSSSEPWPGCNGSLLPGTFSNQSPTGKRIRLCCSGVSDARQASTRAGSKWPRTTQ